MREEAEWVIDRSGFCDWSKQSNHHWIYVCYWFVCIWTLASVCICQPRVSHCRISETCGLIITCAPHSSSCLPLFFPLSRLQIGCSPSFLQSPWACQPSCPLPSFAVPHYSVVIDLAQNARSIKESGHILSKETTRWCAWNRLVEQLLSWFIFFFLLLFYGHNAVKISSMSKWVLKNH